MQGAKVEVRAADFGRVLLEPERSGSQSTRAQSLTSSSLELVDTLLAPEKIRSVLLRLEPRYAAFAERSDDELLGLVVALFEGSFRSVPRHILEQYQDDHAGQLDGAAFV
jgi:hypothetical protein